LTDPWKENERMADDGWWGWPMRNGRVVDSPEVRARLARNEELFREHPVSGSDWVHLDVQVIRRETDKAFQVILEDGSINWLPKSQVCDADEYQAGDRDLTMSVTEWIAQQKGLS
jgi:hypothetical protein